MAEEEDFSSLPLPDRFTHKVRRIAPDSCQSGQYTHGLYLIGLESSKGRV